MKKEISRYFSKLGKKGGKKLFEQRGREYYRKLGKLSWKKSRRSAVDK